MNDAFAAELEIARPMLVDYLRAILRGRRDWAEDLAQDCLVIAMARRCDFDTQQDLGKWLRGIARHKVLERYRADQRRGVSLDANMLDGIDEVFGTVQARTQREHSWAECLQDWMHECLERLDDSQRDILRRFYSEGRSLRELAQSCAVSVAALAQRLSRLREQLRQCLRRREAQENAG